MHAVADKADVALYLRRCCDGILSEHADETQIDRRLKGDKLGREHRGIGTAATKELQTGQDRQQHQNRQTRLLDNANCLPMSQIF